MFNKLPIKILLRENARLRSELRRKEQTVAELLEKFVHNRVPERLQAKSPNDAAVAREYATSYPSDAYSVAMEDAERLADERARESATDAQDHD
jgi:hypothetical protein